MRRIEEFRSQEKHSWPRVGIHGFIVGLRDNETISERRIAIFMGIELERMAHQLAEIADTTLAAGFDEKLQIVLTHPQRLGYVPAGNEIADEDRLLINETKSGDAGFVDLGRNRFVADSADDHPRGDDDGDIRRGPVGGIIMEGKPAR